MHKDIQRNHLVTFRKLGLCRVDRVSSRTITLTPVAMKTTKDGTKAESMDKSRWFWREAVEKEAFFIESIGRL